MNCHNKNVLRDVSSHIVDRKHSLNEGSNTNSYRRGSEELFYGFIYRVLRVLDLHVPTFKYNFSVERTIMM